MGDPRVPGGGTEPFCGDQVTDPNEQCDDGNENPWDGCVACSIPSSCLEVLDLDDEAESGPHLIWPDGVDDYVDVFCDMETDGGGTTFLKHDAGAGAASAEQAEAECKAYGVQGVRDAVVDPAYLRSLRRRDRCCARPGNRPGRLERVSRDHGRAARVSRRELWRSAAQQRQPRMRLARQRR